MVTDENNLSMDLVELDSIPESAWTRLAHAANDVGHPMRLVTLANIDATGHPTARIMVIRGADRAFGCVWFHSDRRSAKVTQLRHDAHACAVAFDPHDRIQLRLYGTVTLHDRDSIADDHWQQTLLSMRHAYGLPTAPAQKLPAADPRLQQIWSHQRSKQIAEDRAHFVVIQMKVFKLEWTQVSGAEQRRMTLDASNGWRVPESPEPVACKP